MKDTSHTIRKYLPSALGIVLTGTAYSQTPIIDSASFFDPDFRARRAGATSGIFAVTVTNTATTATNPIGTPSTKPIWNHSASGFAQTRSQFNIGTILVPIQANLDVQLAAYTETKNDTLVFGREITTKADVLGIPLTDTELPLVNS